MELVQSSFALVQWSTESLVNAYDILLVTPTVVSRFLRKKRRQLRRKHYLRNFVRQIGLAGWRRRSRAPQRRGGRVAARTANSIRPNATARTGRGFVLSPSKAAASENNAASGEKLQSLQDELSKLRAEIDSIMSGAGAEEEQEQQEQEEEEEEEPEPMAEDTMPTIVAESQNMAANNPPQVGTSGGSRPLAFVTADPEPQTFVPPPPPMPTRNSLKRAAKAVAQKNIVAADEEATKENSSATNAKPSKQVSMAPGLPSANEFSQGRKSLRRVGVRRSIGGTPWRTPPKEREMKRLDQMGDNAVSDTQTMIARALRKKFAGLKQQDRKSGGVVAGRGRTAFGEIAN